MDAVDFEGAMAIHRAAREGYPVLWLKFCLCCHTHFSQLGILSGTLGEVFYDLLGGWTAYLISTLYVEYRTRKEREELNFRNHVIQQWIEILDGLLKKHWRNMGLASNYTFLLFGSVIQLIACARMTDNSGILTVKQFQEVMKDICERYPQVKLYLKNKQMHNIVDLLKEAKGDDKKESTELNIEELKNYTF
ncbi:hypothetical protein JHK86_009968 [Glycine max]|nr:hypothetical protein JHK86_009968 [Glycine max]